MTNTKGPVLAPVGHYHGTIHRDRPHRMVRLGLGDVLLDEDELTCWLVAHGVVESGGALFGRRDLPAPADLVDRLIERDLLVELPTRPAEFEAFCRQFRLVPLLHGQGNARVDPGARSFGVGLPERLRGAGELSGRWVGLNVVDYEIWRHGGAARSLADVCEALADPEAQPSRLLRRDTLFDRAVGLVPTVLTSWIGALQPALLAPPVPAPAPPRRVVPTPDPVDDADALDPEEIVPMYLHRAGAEPRVMWNGPRWKATPGHPGAAGWIFAVGHDGGAVYADADGRYLDHVVRVGSEDVELTGPEAAVWTLALGLTVVRPTHRMSVPHPTDRLWNRSAVAAEAVEAGVAGAGRALDSLIERGLVVEVRPGTAQADAFARTYRLHPLLHGLGDEPGDRLGYGVGVPGVRRVDRLLTWEAGLWRMAGQWPSLWDSVVALTGHLRDQGATDVRDIEPGPFLTDRAFIAVRRLLANATAYLDLAPVG